MKSIKLYAIALFVITSLTSIGQDTYFQQFNLPISNDEKESFKVDIQSGDVDIIGVSENIIKIQAEVFNTPGKNYICGPDGCMNVERDDLKLSIKPREGEKIKKIIVSLPFNTPVSIRISGVGNVNISNMHGGIQINTMRLNNISLKQVTGPLSLTGTYGDLDIEFDKGISKQPMAIFLMKGNINIKIPKGEGVTFATSCPDEKSTLKQHPLKRVYSYKHKTDTSYNSNKEPEQNKMNILADYKERIETRESFGFTNKNPRIKGKSISFKEDVWVYDINGGGANVEIMLWQGLIQIKESN